MDWMGTVLNVLEHGFSIWDTKESRRYLKELLKLKRIYAEEYNKPKNFRNNAVMDNVSIQLRILAEGFAELGKPKTRD